MQQTGTPPSTLGLITCLLLVIVCPFFAPTLRADTLLMKDGGRISGKITYQSEAIVRIRNQDGSRTIDKAEIERIEYGPYDPEAEEQEARRVEELEKELEELKNEKEKLEAERNQLAAAQERYQANAAKTNERYNSAIWRSFIYPGWGQYHRGEETKGQIFMYGAGALLFLWYGANQDCIEKRDVYNQSATNALLFASTGNAGAIFTGYFLANSDREAWNAAAQDATMFFSFYVALYVANIVDIYFFDTTEDAADEAAMMRGWYWSVQTRMHHDRLSTGGSSAFERHATLGYHLYF